MNGQESSILCLLAQRPDMPWGKFRKDLDGHAMAVAQYITGHEKNPAPDVKATGDHFIKCMRERAEAEAAEKARRCPTCGQRKP